jgi:hypothetical protein
LVVSVPGGSGHGSMSQRGQVTVLCVPYLGGGVSVSVDQLPSESGVGCVWWVDQHSCGLRKLTEPVPSRNALTGWLSCCR